MLDLGLILFWSAIFQTVTSPYIFMLWDFYWSVFGLKQGQNYILDYTRIFYIFEGHLIRNRFCNWNRRYFKLWFKKKEAKLNLKNLEKNNLLNPDWEFDSSALQLLKCCDDDWISISFERSLCFYCYPAGWFSFASF